LKRIDLSEKANLRNVLDAMERAVGKQKFRVFTNTNDQIIKI
jgi:hypothetical protein